MIFLYRTLDVDDDCDPLDHGLLRAKNIDHAKELLAPHLEGILGTGNVPVRFYELKDTGEDGVFDNMGPHVDTTIEFGSET